MSDKSIKLNAWDYSFLLWFFTDSCFNHTIIGIVGQAIFLLFSMKEMIANKKIAPSFTCVAFALFCFTCWYNIKSGNALSVGTASFMLNVLLRNLVFIYFLYIYLSSRNINVIVDLFIKTCIVSSVVIIAYNFLLTGSIVMRDIEGSINGNFQAVNNAIAIGLIYATDNKENKYWIYKSILLFVFCILAGTRKAIIVMAIMIGCQILMRHPRKIVSNLIKLGFAGGVLLFLMFKVDFIYDIIGNRFEGIVGFMNDTGDVDASTETRSQFIELGMSYFTYSPWYGYGIDCFREIKGAHETYSHNNYVEILFGVGIPGIITYYSMYFFPLVKGIKNWIIQNNTNVILGVTMCIGCLFADYGMVSYFDRSTYLKIIMIVLFVNCSSSNEQQNINAQISRK